MTEEMTGEPEGTVDAPTEEEDMEVGSTATEAREAANTAAGTSTTPEPERTAPTTGTPEAGGTPGDRSEIGKPAGGTTAAMAVDPITAIRMPAEAATATWILDVG